MFFCKCLNVICELNNGCQKSPNATSFKFNFIQQSTTMDASFYELLDFFKSAVGPIALKDSGAALAVKHDVFVQKLQMDKWTVSKCLNCDCYVYAIDANEEMLLVNAQLLRDNNHLLLETIMNDKNFSLPFKVILKPIEESNISALKLNINGDARLKGLFGRLQDFIAKDSSDTEAEIRRLTLAMSQRRQHAERDFQLIVTLINSIDNNSTTMEQSTKLAMSTDITPPVTPESAQLSIDDHHKSMMAAAAASMSPAMKIPQNHHREGLTKHKHSNALLQKQIVTRTIDFDEDIFELDGMQEISGGGATNDIDHYHKYSDTETSDVEEMAEKRPARVRSGSACIARSAPISMPQFMHHANIHNEDKRNNINENDIASSIKLLAKSIHADAIFELPVRRSTVKYNADF